MTIIIEFPRDTSSHIRNAICQSLGMPLERVYKDSVDVYLFPHLDDPEDAHFKISQYISKIFRKKYGHDFFMSIHTYFNDHVKVLLDERDKVLQWHCSEEQLKSLKRIFN